MIGAPSNFHGCRRQGTDVAANFGKPDVFTWAGGGLSASMRGSMNSCRLCKSESLAFISNFADVWSECDQEQGITRQAIRSWSDNRDDDVAKEVRTMTHHIVWLQEMAASEFVGDKFPAGDIHH